MRHDMLPTNKPKDTLADDLEFMYELPAEDRYSFIHTIMGNKELWKLDIVDEKQLEWIKSYYIKDYRGEGNTGFSEADKPTVHALEEQAFLRLGQCKIADINTTQHQPYVKVNMSECSLLIARGENRLWMAHIGMSEHTQMKHALEQLKEAGFDPGDIQAVASVGPRQEAANEGGHPKRLASKSDYEAYGIAPGNITPFRFIGQTEIDNPRMRQLCEVIVGTDGMLVTTFDADIYWKQGFFKEDIIEETVAEQFVAPQVPYEP